MEKALEKTADEDTRRVLMQTFLRVATALRNKPEADNPLKVTSA
jgi:truncated hemoglobin YjbI